MTDQELNEQVARKLGKGHIQEGWEKVCIIPDYCHSIAAAWEIWDHFHEMATLTKHEGKWMLDYGRRFRIVADTAPKAICLAFLKLDKPAKQE